MCACVSADVREYKETNYLFSFYLRETENKEVEDSMHVVYSIVNVKVTECNVNITHFCCNNTAKPFISDRPGCYSVWKL